MKADEIMQVKLRAPEEEATLQSPVNTSQSQQKQGRTAEAGTT